MPGSLGLFRVGKKITNQGYQNFIFLNRKTKQVPVIYSLSWSCAKKSNNKEVSEKSKIKKGK